MKFTSIYLILFFLVSCSTSVKPKYKSDATLEKGLPIHGNFCGKNIPTISEKNIPKRIKILNKIEAIDHIDATCKNHDLCYAKKGYGNKYCDSQLIKEINALKITSSPSCKTLQRTISTYFIISKPSSHKNKKTYIAESVQDTVNTSVGAASTVAVKGISLGLMAAVGVISVPLNILKGRNPIKPLGELAKGTKPFRDDTYNAIPNRYSLCFE